MENFLAFPFDELPFVFIALVIAFTVHEFAHAYMAYLFGDDTANAQGRVTLDPRAHLDWLGTILVLFVGFGWAKPVPVNRSRFSRPRLMSIIVTFAGPLSNLLMCLLALFLEKVLVVTGITDMVGVGGANAIYTFFEIFVNLNLILFLFNLIPLPPLDGYRIVEDLAPRPVYNVMQKYEHFGYLILILLFVIPQFRAVVLGPLYLMGGALLATFEWWMMLLFGAGM